MKKKLKKAKTGIRKTDWFITGHLYRESARSVARVPVIFDGVMPDVPGIISIGKEHFVCTNTNPVTYHKAHCFKAEEVI
jgi:hypothetical protein